eukprot:3472413-Lingulodinium_polyedra.AAC.1
MQLAVVEAMKQCIPIWFHSAIGLHVRIESLTFFRSRASGHHAPQSDLDIVLQFPPETQVQYLAWFLGPFSSGGCTRPARALLGSQ